MTPFAKRCELEALKVQALGLLIENVGRLITNGTTAPFGSAEANLLAHSIRALAMEQKVVTMRRHCDIDGAWVLECPGTFEIFDTRAQALKVAGERGWLVRDEVQP